MVAHVEISIPTQVLKPQREGGGHNMYGDELVEALTTTSDEDLKQ